MASGSRNRARKLARAKVDRQLARRAAALRRRRRIQAGVGASLTLLLITFGTVWLLGGFEKDKTNPAAESPCRWTPRPGEPDRDDVGTPPTTGIATEGQRAMTLTINNKPIVVEVDLADAPCAGASFSYLAAQGYFNNTKCHELNTTEGTLRCGDKKGAGLGGPTYSFANENVPFAPEPATPTPSTSAPSPSAGPTASPQPTASPTPPTPPLYPKGTVAMIGSPPGSNGSQFVIFYKDFSPPTPDYSIVGHITGDGLKVIDEIVKAGTVKNSTGQPVKPKNDVVLQSLTFGPVSVPGDAPSATPPTPGATPSGTPSAAPSATPSAAS